MTDDQHGEGAPRSGGRWDPLPQGDYDDGATAFVKLPEGGIDALLASADSPLAAPGHGYVPPRITAAPDQTAGEWGTPDGGGQWPDPNAAPHEGGDDRFAYRPGAAQQWTYDGHQVPEAHEPYEPYAPYEQHRQDAAQDAAGQWSIPLAGGDLPDESGEFTTSSLVQQWGGTPPATLPGGAAAPWANAPADPAGPTGPEGPADPGAAQGPPGQPWGQEQGLPGSGPEYPGQAYGTPAHSTPAHGTPAHGVPAEATPDQGAPVHGTPPYGTPAHGTPAHHAPDHGTPAHGVQLPHGTPAHGVPAADAHAPVAPGPAADPEDRTHDAPPHAGPFPGAEHEAGAADDGRYARHPAPGPQPEPAADLAPAPVAEPAPAAAEEPREAAVAEEPGEAPEARQEPAEAADGATEPDASPAPDADDPAATADPGTAAADEPPPPPGEEHPLASYVLRVNGVERPVTDAWIGESLLYVLRERLGLAGAKDGCSQGECGACNVQVDGRLVASCLVPAVTAAGSEVRTVEGLAEDGRPSDVQRALARCGAVQCGFCVPGMAMTVHDLLEGNPAPTELETRQALCGNLCRCSGYRGVLNAVNEVVAEREAHSAEPAEHDGDEPRIPHQAGPGSGGVNPSAFDPSTHDQAYGQDGGQA
ncbi:2Fe-2S iron-sulfur cluster-binding protein [Streptomyces sp. ACT015]|uniref:(2Fe-2S)-binding protein n=1 Tax=Streptomyces sp. ACT015 TaxID=3134807 RepID=UPI003D163A96